ncbi:MAG: peptidylprolyl isomerase [Bacteroidota bacterium]
MKHHLIIPALFILVSCSTNQNPKITINTELGPIVAELYPDKAPVTCENFLRYVENNMFDSSSFYRVVRMDNQPNNEIKIEVIQGGLGFDRLDGGYPPIFHESTDITGFLHKDGTLSMARAEPGSASSEFFICIGDQPELDFGGQRNPDGQGFAAFGQIIEGMNVVRKIQSLEDKDQMLVKEVIITSISIF